MRRRRPAHPRLAAVIWAGALVLVVGCSAEGAPGRGSLSPGSTGSTGSPSQTVPVTVQVTPNGAGPHPAVTLRLPSSNWVPFKEFAVTSDGGGASRGVSVWDVGFVAKDPCHSLGRLYDPGPTVADLVRALRAQSRRHASLPQEVSLAGHPAVYLTWSVPGDAIVTGDADFSGCDVQPQGRRDFVSWEGTGHQGERFQQMAGQVDELWIVDVDGHRLLVDASRSPSTTPAQLREEDQIVQSIQFATGA